MAVINVVKAFDYNVPPSIIDWREEGNRKYPVYGPVVRVKYDVGFYEVSDAMAEDAYVKAHLDGYEEPPRPRPSMGQGAQQALWAQQAVRMATPIERQVAAATPPPPTPASPQALSVPAATTWAQVPPPTPSAHYFAGQPQEDKPMPTRDPLSNIAWAQPSKTE